MVKLRRMKWAGHVARMGEIINVYSVTVRTPKAKGSLGRPRFTWVDKIKWFLEGEV
jgi:hypothetical protein